MLLFIALASTGFTQDLETTVTQPLLLGQHTSWKDLKLSVVAIEDNNPETPVDNTATLFLQIGDAYYERTLENYHSSSVGSYEVYAREIRAPSGASPGYVTLRLIYLPPMPTPRFLRTPTPPIVIERPAPQPNQPQQPATLRRTLSVGGEVAFGSVRVRLLRVDANNPLDRNDDTATFVINTPTESVDSTIAKYHSDFIGDWEIYVEDVRPSGAPGRGRCTIVLRYTAR
jgi:hypothetical protein